MKNKRYKASGEDSGAVWQLQEAKACFSEVVRRAEACPQKVTVRGKDAVVVLSASDYECLRPESKQGLSELMAASPLAEVEFGKRGDGMPVREVDLFLAAAAQTHDLCLATRNTSDFDGTGVALTNPWSEAG